MSVSSRWPIVVFPLETLDERVFQVAFATSLTGSSGFLRSLGVASLTRTGKFSTQRDSEVVKVLIMVLSFRLR